MSCGSCAGLVYRGGAKAQPKGGVHHMKRKTRRSKKAKKATRRMKKH